MSIPERTINRAKWVLPKLTGIPDTLDSVSVFVLCINFDQAFYQSLKADRIKDKEYIDTFLPEVDTLKCCKKYINIYIPILTGLGKDSIMYYIPETNNNYDFGDEKAYILNWKPAYFKNKQLKLHRIKYERFCKDSIILDSTFINVGIDEHEIPFDTSKVIHQYRKLKSLSLCINESRSMSFRFNNINYSLVLTPGIGGYYDRTSKFYIYTKYFDFSSYHQPYKRLGDNIKFDNTNYFIHDIVDNGEKILFVKGWRF